MVMIQNLPYYIYCVAVLTSKKKCALVIQLVITKSTSVRGIDGYVGLHLPLPRFSAPPLLTPPPS
jgi:hypothetical protein